MLLMNTQSCTLRVSDVAFEHLASLHTEPWKFEQYGRTVGKTKRSTFTTMRQKSTRSRRSVRRKLRRNKRTWVDEWLSCDTQWSACMSVALKSAVFFEIKFCISNTLIVQKDLFEWQLHFLMICAHLWMTISVENGPTKIWICACEAWAWEWNSTNLGT